MPPWRAREACEPPRTPGRSPWLEPVPASQGAASSARRRGTSVATWARMRQIVSIGIIVLGASAQAAERPGTPQVQRFFLTHPGGMEGAKEADIYLSAVRLDHPALRRLAARGKVSPRRWVDIENAV